MEDYSSDADSPLEKAEESPKFELSSSRQFSSWLGEQNLSIAFTTYQAGKVFFVGLNPNGRLSVFERTFARCMGLAGDDQTLWMSSLFQMWRLENTLPQGELSNGYDRLYVPRAAYTTGDLDVHDIAVGEDGKPIFIATLFSCIATISDTHSIKPLWKPPFISRLAAEDRCHLNGLATENGKPKYVTAVSQTDITDGWRDHRQNGGILMDVENNEVIVNGLSMPHSPRLHDGGLYLADSGTGRFGKVDLGTGRFEEIAICPGFVRGVAIVNGFAVIGLSMPRHNKTFSGLALQETLAEKGVEPRCGIMVIDLKTGDTVHWLRLHGMITELYDVVALPNVRRPSALGLRSDEIRRTISLEPNQG